MTQMAGRSVRACNKFWEELEWNGTDRDKLNHWEKNIAQSGW